MVIHVTPRRVPLDDELREHVVRRIRFALGRFAGRISRVHVRILDENGPRGGVDTRCAVHAHLPRLGLVIAEETSHSIAAAVDVAADRAGRAVARRIDRSLDSRRGRTRAA